MRAIGRRPGPLAAGFGGLVVVGLVAFVASGLGASGRACTAAPAAGVASKLPAAPSVFASAEQSSSGARTEIVLRSVANGRVVRAVGAFGDDFTNNGLALSPNGRVVYFTLIPRERGWSNLLIERIAGSRRKRLVAHGWEPSLSPNGRLLASISYRGRSESVAITDISTGQSRSINVDAVVGRGEVLDETPAGWLSDNSTVVLPTGPPAMTVGATASAPAVAHRRIRPQAPTIRLVVVTIAANGRVSAGRIVVAGIRGYLQTLAGNSIANTITGVMFADGGALLDQIHLSPTSGAGCQLLDIHGGLVLSFDPTGDRLLYLLGSSPPALWSATVTDGRISDRKRLFKDSPVGATAW